MNVDLSLHEIYELTIALANNPLRPHIHRDTSLDEREKYFNLITKLQTARREIESQPRLGDATDSVTGAERPPVP